MNLNENILRIQEMMGIITEDSNKVIISMIDEMGINTTIDFLGSLDKFESLGGIDYLFNEPDELLKDYTNLIILEDYEDEGGGDGGWKSVAYGEGNDDYRIKPGYVYFNWVKNPMDKPTAHLYVDKALSDHLKPLDIPDEITKMILKKWVNKYYDNIPPIDEVTFGNSVGYGNEEDDYDDAPKPMRTGIVSSPIIPLDNDDVDEEISEEEIIKLIKDAVKKYPKEDYKKSVREEQYDDLFNWTNLIFSDVEDKLGDIEYDDLRKDYDYILMDIWGPSLHTPYREMFPR